MAHRLILVGTAVLLAAVGIWFVFQGITDRNQALPQDMANAMSIVPAREPGSVTGPSSLEWVTLQANRRIHPALDQEGAVLFHAGIGLTVAAWVLALLGATQSIGLSRVIGILWLVPAAWALWMIADHAGPLGQPAPLAMHMFRVYAPLYVFFLLLGLFFRSDRQTESQHGSRRSPVAPAP